MKGLNDSTIENEVEDADVKELKNDGVKPTIL